VFFGCATDPGDEASDDSSAAVSQGSQELCDHIYGTVRDAKANLVIGGAQISVDFPQGVGTSDYRPTDSSGSYQLRSCPVKGRFVGRAQLTLKLPDTMPLATNEALTTTVIFYDEPTRYDFAVSYDPLTKTATMKRE
jgi:hypothetical protein